MNNRIRLCSNKLTIHQIMLFSLTTLLFFEPISKSMNSIFLVLIAACVLLTPAYRKTLGSVICEPWCVMMLMLIVFATVSCLWSPATTKEKWFVLYQYNKLLYLPLLVIAFRATQVQIRALVAFMMAMMLVAILSILKHQGLLLWGPIDPGHVFLNHIVTAMMMSLAGYLAALFFIQEKRNVRYAWGMLYLLYTYQILFVGTGRTGYILYSLLMVLLIVQFSSLKQLISRILVSVFILAGVFNVSPVMQAGVNHVIHDLQQFKHKEKNTSIGYRIEFHKYAYHNFIKHPLVGNGTGSLNATFHKDNPIPTWHSRIFQPHSQYWFLAAELGCFGLILYMGFLLFFLKATILTSELRIIARGLFIIIIIGNLTDALFYNSTSGHFLITMMALCLSHLKPKPLTLLSLDEVMTDGRLRQAQLKMVNMLKTIDTICQKHGIDYWLDAGTLLGAVRHQGFIPWDDDMDIGMPRESFEAFLEIAPKELPDDIWLQTAETDTGFYNLGTPLKIRDRNSYYLEKHENGDEPYVKSIFIDVFVYDFLPDNPKRRKRYKTCAKKLLRILSTKYSKVPMGHYAELYRFIGYFFPKRLLVHGLNQIILKSNQENGTFLGRGYQCKNSNLVHYDDVYPLKKLKFESGEFNVFNHADVFLTAEYGNYMVLPPLKDRKMRHCKALIPELSVST